MYNQRLLTKITLFMFSLSLSLIAIPVMAKSPPKMSVDKMEEFSILANDPQGLTWTGSHLWLADDDTNMLYKINPSNGKIINSIPSPGPQPRGLAWDGKDLWCSDSKKEKIYQLNPKTGEVISSIDAPVSKAVNTPVDSIRGLAWDGEYLWSAYYAGYGSKICRVNPKTGIVDKSFYPGGVPQALTCDGEFLYCVSNSNYRAKNIYNEYNFIRCFNLPDTLLSSYIKIPSVHPRGLAGNGDAFWHVDKKIKAISKIKIKKR